MATSSAILRMYGSSFVKGKFCQVDGEWGRHAASYQADFLFLLLVATSVRIDLDLCYRKSSVILLRLTPHYLFTFSEPPSL